DPVLLARLDLEGHDLAFGLHLGEAPAHETLDRVDGVFRVDGRLAAGELAYEPLSRPGGRDHRGRGPRPFRIGDDHRVAGLDDGDDGVGRSKVDSNCLWHLVSSSADLPACWLPSSRPRALICPYL